MSQYGQVTKSHTFQDFVKLVFWLHTARIENPDYPKTHASASDLNEYHSDAPRHHSDIPQTPPRHPQGTWYANRHQQTPTDTTRHPKTLTGAVWVCLVVSVGVCCCLLACCVPWSCLGGVWGMSGWCLGVFWVVLLEIGDARMRFGCIWVLQYGAKILIWQSYETCDVLSPDHTETLKYQNLPM